MPSVADVLREESHTLGDVSTSGHVPPGDDDPSPTERQKARQGSALCLSGTDGRSVAFNLGILQSLARHGLLDEFDYVSGVAGGSCLGGWLNAWVIHDPEGMAGVSRSLGRSLTGGAAEPEPIRHLREARRALGVESTQLSPDPWVSVIIYVRNLLLNWLVVLPLAAATLLMVWLPLTLFDARPPRIYDVIYSWIAAVVASIQSSIPRVFEMIGVTSVPESLAVDSYAWGHASVVLTLTAISGSIGFADLYFGPMKQDRPHTPDRLADDVAVDTTPWRCVACLFLFACGMAVWWALDWTRQSRWTVVPFVGLGLITHLVAGALRRHSDGNDATADWPQLAIAGGAGGLLTWWMASSLFAQPVAVRADAVRGLPLYASAFLIVFLIPYLALVALTSPQAKNRAAASARRIGRVFTASMVWSGMTVLVIIGPALLERLPPSAVPLAVLLSLIVLLAGQHLWIGLRSRPLLAMWRWATGAAARTFASFVFLCVFVAAVSLATSRLIQMVFFAQLATLGTVAALPGAIGADGTQTIVENTSLHLYAVSLVSPWQLLAVATALVLVSILMSRQVDINAISRCGALRWRLVSTYLASVRAPLERSGAEIDIPLHQLLRPRTSDAQHDSASAWKPAPFLIVNMAREFGPWDHRLEPWTASPLHVGGPELGFRTTSMLGSLSLGTAMAISSGGIDGHGVRKDSALQRMVAALLNLRPSWWVDSSNWAGRSESWMAAVFWPVYPWIGEALPSTTDVSSWTRLTGGHKVESLAIYEMVRRRCRLIVAVDTSEDPSFVFEALGVAIRRIRIDLGVRIEFRQLPDRTGGRYCAIGDVMYSETEPDTSNGVLVYIKPVVNGGEPRDVLSYASMHPAFPHERIPAERFSESQFENYRALSVHVIDTVCGTAEQRLTLTTFEEAARRYTRPVETMALPSRADRSVERLEQEVHKLVGLIAAPALDNYQGVLCAAPMKASSEWALSSSAHLAQQPARSQFVEVWLQPRQPESGAYEPVTIRNGRDAAELQFEVTVKSQDVEFGSPPTQSLRVSPHEPSPRLRFWFRKPETVAAPQIIVQLVQKNRLVQVLRVSTEPPSDAESRPETEA